MLLLQQLQQAGMVLLQQQAGMLLLHQAGMFLARFQAFPLFWRVYPIFLEGISSLWAAYWALGP